MNVKKLDSTKIYWLDKEETVKAQLVGLDMPHGFGSVKYTFRILFGGTGDIVYMDSNLPKTIHEVVEQKPWQFTTHIAMRCTEEQFNEIKDKLVEMGYKTKHITFCSAQRYIATCYGDESNLISDLNLTAIEASQTKRINTGSFNPDLFLALAAMTDKEDGIKGEWWKCGPILTKQDAGIFGNYSSGWRKATAQEIIEHFEKKGLVLPKKWCVKIEKANFEVISKYAEENYNIDDDYLPIRGFLLCESRDKSYQHWGDAPKSGYTEITFDQFKRYVLKETEFTLPKNWAVKLTEEYEPYFKRRFCNVETGYWVLFTGHFNKQTELPSGCTEITCEQFVEYVLRIPNSLSKNEAYAWDDILGLFNVEYKTALSKFENSHIEPICVSFIREYHTGKEAKETAPSCPKTPVVGSIEYAVNVEFDAEKAAEEIFAKIVEFGKSSQPKYKFTWEPCKEKIEKFENFLELFYPFINIKNTDKTVIPIPPTKQATLFDDRVEITDWEPKDGEYVFVVKTSTGEYYYDHIVYKKRDYVFFKNGFIKRTESEAKQLVEKLKQAML